MILVCSSFLFGGKALTGVQYGRVVPELAINFFLSQFYVSSVFAIKVKLSGILVN